MHFIELLRPFMFHSICDSNSLQSFVHWLLMGGLLRFVQRGGVAAWLSPVLAVPNVTAHPSTVSVPTSYCSSMWHFNCL